MEVLIVVWLMFGIFSAVIASSKNRSGFGWFILGSLFGIFAFIAIAAMPKAEKTSPAS